MTLPQFPYRSGPDDGYDPNNLSALLTDNAEIAARLGSPDTLRRTGKVAWLDEMSVLNPWAISASGGSADIVSSMVMRGFSSLRLTPPASTNSMSVQRYFPSMVTDRMGFEVSIAPKIMYGTITNGYRAYMMVGQIVGGILYQGGLRIDWLNNVIAYMNYVGNYTNIFNISASSIVSNPQWANLKIVIDLTSFQTIRAYYNNQSAIITASPLNSGGAAGDFAFVDLEVMDMDSIQRPCYFADAVLTLDEA